MWLSGKTRNRVGPNAATRDLVDLAEFDRDIMGLLSQSCTG